MIHRFLIRKSLSQFRPPAFSSLDVSQDGSSPRSLPKASRFTHWHQNVGTLMEPVKRIWSIRTSSNPNPASPDIWSRVISRYSNGRDRLLSSATDPPVCASVQSPESTIGESLALVFGSNGGDAKPNENSTSLGGSSKEALNKVGSTVGSNTHAGPEFCPCLN